MRLQIYISQTHWIKTFIYDILHCIKIIQALTHFLSIHLQEIMMHPKFYKFLACRCFCLGNFIGMMNRNMIYAASMDIDRVYTIDPEPAEWVKTIKQSFQTHRAAFNMPPGKPNAPGTIPLHLTLLCGVISSSLSLRADGLSRVEGSSIWITKLP